MSGHEHAECGDLHGFVLTLQIQGVADSAREPDSLMSTSTLMGSWEDGAASWSTKLD